ncbi:hypothetical protein [Spongiactinospora sp. TRM90649]|uniref:hypothetical protein n=1 Tax=Spongiactinospora sp. TRM90649 TaxID=3031114 RepID=UPI0023F9ECDB|nr:hypothetical protein [Spongiactinospora sp. TRM90649]MDF5754293.1 hypothetical protein [Spongiactinospora sp. TRM90649]
MLPAPPDFPRRESEALALAGDELVAIDANGLVWTWNRRTGRTTRAQIGGCPDGSGPLVAEAAFDPLGRTVAVSDSCGQTALWDVTSGRHLITFPGAQDDPGLMANGRRTLAFTPDGGTLRRGGTSWDVRPLAAVAAPDTAIAAICAAVRRDLNTAERAAYLTGQAPSPTCPTS